MNRINFALLIPPPPQHQGEVGEREEGEDQAAGIRWRRGHGKREKDLPAANV